MNTQSLNRLIANSLTFIFAICCLLFSCVKNPITGKREFHMVGEKAELNLGQESKKQLIQEYGLYANPRLQSYIHEVGQKLVAVSERQKLPYEFVILDTPLVNAFAVPGVVFLTRGILELIDDEAELAAVIGHEIGHITGYHAVKLIQKAMGYQFLSTFATVAAVLYGPRADDPRAYAVMHEATNLVAGGFLSGYGRQFELEADRSGLKYAILAGYDPEAMISFFKRLHSLGEEKSHGIGIFLRTHPPTEQRIKQVRRELALLAGESETNRKKRVQTQTHQRAAEILRSTEPAAFTDHFERYQEIVKNLPKIPDPSGKIMGNHYENSDFKIRLKAPPNWQLEQSYGNSLVKFYSPNGKAQGELQAMKIVPDPLVFASENRAFAGTHLSSPTLNVREWAENMEKEFKPIGNGFKPIGNGFKLKKRTGREVNYPAGPVYVATYQGRDKTGRPAHFKFYYLLAKRNAEGEKLGVPFQHGFILFCAAPEESYLDYLLDFESIMNSIAFLP